MPDNVLIWLGGLAITVIGSLVGLLYRDHKQVSRDQWKALEKCASAETLRELREGFTRALENQRTEHAERVREMQKGFEHRMAEMAARHDRELDAVKDEISQLNAGINELRRDWTAGHMDILAKLQDIALRLPKATQ